MTSITSDQPDLRESEDRWRSGLLSLETPPVPPLDQARLQAIMSPPKSKLRALLVAIIVVLVVIVAAISIWVTQIGRNEPQPYLPAEGVASSAPQTPR